MKTVDDLPKTTFSGRRFTRKQLVQVQEVARMFPTLSRKELAQTVCEHFDWTTPKGRNKISSGLKLLEELEGYGLITLPAKKEKKKPTRRKPEFREKPDTTPINATLASIGPIRLKQVISKDDRENWKAYLESYHYLGYKRPFGSYLGYFVVSETTGQKLGCLLFTASASWALAPRDKWIGWDKKHRSKLLHLILSNDRFLIFPWVNVPNLASHVLSLVTKRIGADWVHTYGYRPVLIETFVDTTRYSGSCYQAANWQLLGQTQGRGRFDPKHEHKETVKDIYAFPLRSDWRECLVEGHRIAELKKRYRNDLQSSRTRSVGDEFIALWKNVVHIFHEVAEEYDEKWRVRNRVIDSLLLMLLIFRLVSSKNTQSYGTTIDDLWDSCDRLGISVPQKGSIAPSSFCVARKKMDEEIFKTVNRRILDAYAPESPDQKWKGHRLFAVDGSKINLPRKLIDFGYKVPSKNANRPQGTLSCLFDIKTQMPFDFELVSHADERMCAKNHLRALKTNDVVVYDRGYFSYLMLRNHYDTGIHAIFRLQSTSNSEVIKFIAGSNHDTLVTIYPSKRVRQDIIKVHPDFDFIPLTMRLMKYEIGNTLYCLGTTLVDKHELYPLRDFMDVYHSRWGVEELYKVSKQIFTIEDFHAKTERGVKQEIYAHFALISMNRLFANRADSELNQDSETTEGGATPGSRNSLAFSNQTEKIKTNFKNCVHVFSRRLEELLFLGARFESLIQRAFEAIVGRHQKVRPNRSYPRRSLKPVSKWMPPKQTKQKRKTASAAAVS